MNIEKNLEKKWLIKSENKILGPYGFDQVIDLIRKKQISIIDEVRDPETRWLYVRENPIFKDIVEEIRKEIDAKQESTKTYQSVSKTIPEEDLVKTKTDFGIENSNNENTSDVDVINELLSKSRAVTEVAPPSTPSAANYTNRHQSKSQSVSSVSTKSYGAKTDQAVQQKVSIFTKRLFLGVLSIIAIVAIGMFSYMYIQKINNQKHETDLLVQVKKLKLLGLNKKAAEQFDKLPSALQKKVLPDLLDIYPTLEEAGYASYQDIKNIPNENLSSEQKANIELINFYADMKKQNYGEAQEKLVKATAYFPSSQLIKENEAILSLKKGEHSRALSIYRNIIKQEKNGRTLLGMVLSYNGLPAPEKNTTAKEVLNQLQRYTSAFYDYRKELLLAQTLIAKDLNDELIYKVSIKQFLNTPISLTAEFLTPALLAPESYTWKELNEIKSNVQKLLTGDELLLFQLHDILQQKQLSAATDFLDANLSRASNNAVRDQMNLLVLNSQNRSKEAITLEKSNNLDMNSELNHLLLAQNKLKQDPSSNIGAHVAFFETKKLNFYRDWLKLDQLIKQNSIDPIRNFLKEHFVTVDNFSPVFVAKSMVN